MSSFNKVILMGNITRDPELRSTPGGAQVTDVSIAVNDNWTDAQGNKQERVTFVDITFWGKQAETLCRWKKKGDPLLVEGRLQMDEWNDKQSGEKRKKLKVVGVGFTFVGRGGGAGGGEGGGGQGGNRGSGGYNKGGGNRSGGKPAAGGGAPSDEGSYDDSYATNLPPGGGEEPPF
ncbi:MAG: single-stranded DNA-binding protein [Planctomycetes bacterium]|nr:single-stranded DNA-binding protein [Planctomycetota bacterium]